MQVGALISYASLQRRCRAYCFAVSRPEQIALRWQAGLIRRRSLGSPAWGGRLPTVFQSSPSRRIEGEYTMFLKRSFVIALSFFMAMFIADCGSYTTTGGSPYGGSSSSTVIQTATVTVKGQSEMVLTDAQGMTLYYFTVDSATQSTCSSSCAQMWHPLLFTGSGRPSSSTPLAGKLSVKWMQTGARSSITAIRSTPSQETLPRVRPMVRAFSA